ncbi:MAG: DUF4136 domain-containing protein [Burkholderiaceae bacterium]
MRMRMRMRGFRLLGLGFLALMLGACASPVRNQVSVYHDWPAALTERSYRFAAPPQGDDLAYRTFRAVVEQRLAAGGFRRSPSPALEVAFSFVENRRSGQVVEQVPAVSSHLSIGSWGRHGGLSIGFPLYWGWPYADVVRQVDFYERTLTLEIADIRSGTSTPIYKATASNRGEAPAGADALRYLVDAVLDDFPGRSGVIRQVSFDRSEAK